MTIFLIYLGPFLDPWYLYEGVTFQNFLCFYIFLGFCFSDHQWPIHRCKWHTHKYTHVYINTHTQIYIYIYIYMRVCVSVCMYVATHTCAQICKHIYSCAYALIYVFFKIYWIHIQSIHTNKNSIKAFMGKVAIGMEPGKFL